VSVVVAAAVPAAAVPLGAVPVLSWCREVSQGYMYHHHHHHRVWVNQSSLTVGLPCYAGQQSPLTAGLPRHVNSISRARAGPPSRILGGSFYPHDCHAMYLEFPALARPPQSYFGWLFLIQTSRAR